MLFQGFNFNDCSPEHSKPKQTQFYFETNCIVYLFEQFLPKINFEDISSVQFDCFPNAEYTCEPIIMDGVLPVTIPYRVSDFYSLSDIDKKKRHLS